MNIKFIGKQLLGILAIFCLFYFLDRNGVEKYTIAAAFSILFLFLGRKNKWNIMTVLLISLPTMLYVFLGGISAIFHGCSQISTVKTIGYVLLPLLLCFAMFTYFERNFDKVISWQFIASFLVYIVPNAWIIVRGYTWESSFAFAYGIFTIYYLYRKKWILAGFSLAFMYLADKRIALFGVLVTVCLMMVIAFFQNSRKVVYAIWTAVIACIYGYLHLIYTGKLESICWGLNVNTNGRVQMYTRIVTEHEFLSNFGGNGIGIIENLLQYLKIDTYANLHNDLLKLYIELGFLGLLIYLCSYYFIFYMLQKYYGKSQMRYYVGISIYSMILFATDNVSIYLIYLIPFYSTLYTVLSTGKKLYYLEELDDTKNN